MAPGSPLGARPAPRPSAAQKMYLPPAPTHLQQNSNVSQYGSWGQENLVPYRGGEVYGSLAQRGSEDVLPPAAHPATTQHAQYKHWDQELLGRGPGT